MSAQGGSGAGVGSNAASSEHQGDGGIIARAAAARKESNWWRTAARHLAEQQKLRAELELLDRQWMQIEVAYPVLRAEQKQDFLSAYSQWERRANIAWCRAHRQRRLVSKHLRRVP